MSNLSPQSYFPQMTPWVIGNFSKSHVAFRSGGLTIRAADEWARRAFFEYCSDLGAIPLSSLIFPSRR
jgi:hypothetical protein